MLKTKFELTLVICVALLGLGNAQLKWNINPNPSMLVGLNQTIQAVLASRANASSNTTEFWDLMPKHVRVLLTNQTGLPNSWNLTEAALVNSYFTLRWDELPKELQTRLLAQKNSTASLLPITFLKWNLVNGTDFRANLTIDNLVTPMGLSMLLKACSLLDQITYDMQIDVARLSGLLRAIPGYYTNYNIKHGQAFDRLLRDVPLFRRPSSNNNDVNRFLNFLYEPHLFPKFGDSTRLLFGSLFGLLDNIVYVPQDFNYWV